jgi:processing peptidase subunit beta
MLNAFRSANYTGENIVVVGTGGVDHDAFVEQVNAAFGSLNQQSEQARNNAEKCIYTPALLMMRDDEMYNANVGVFYDAPSVNHEDYYSFQLMKHMIGDYDIQKNAEHLNDTQKQYNATQGVLGELPDVTRQTCIYNAYSDCGLWGSYFFGNEVFVRQMNWVGCAVPTNYGDYVNEVEVVRARNAYWNELMHEQSPMATN